jgi:hypothetical protein
MLLAKTNQYNGMIVNHHVWYMPLNYSSTTNVLHLNLFLLYFLFALKLQRWHSSRAESKDSASDQGIKSRVTASSMVGLYGHDAEGFRLYKPCKTPLEKKRCCCQQWGGNFVTEFQ